MIGVARSVAVGEGALQGKTHFSFNLGEVGEL